MATPRVFTAARITSLLLGLSLSAATVSCGGGGGGSGSSSPNYPGDLSFRVERSQIDPGDKNRVYVEIDNLNSSGAILKFRYPNALRYVPNSAWFFRGMDEAVHVAPYDETSLDGDRYLVFFLYPSSAINDSFITLEFDLKAVKSNSDAFIEVDLDNNDQGVPDSIEFRPSDPRFSALEKWDVEIEGQSTDVTPTPATTGTPSATATPKP